MEKKSKKIKTHNNRIMKQNGLFFLDVLSIMPKDGTLCYIQAPDLEDSLVMQKTDDPTLMLMRFDNDSLDKIKIKIMLDDIQDFIMYISIRNNGIIYFEGYDGIEFGIFSKFFHIPRWFIKKYKQENRYGISTDW